MNQPLKEYSRCKGQGDIHGTQKTTGFYWVQCCDCKARTEDFDKRMEAEFAWNQDELIN